MATAMIGIILCEFCAGRGIDRMLDPVCDRVRRRYEYVRARDSQQS